MDMREEKSAGELAQMISNEINDPSVRISVYASEVDEAGWIAQDIIHGSPNAAMGLRVREAAVRLGREYRLVDDFKAGRLTGDAEV